MELHNTSRQYILKITTLQKTDQKYTPIYYKIASMFDLGNRQWHFSILIHDLPKINGPDIRSSELWNKDDYLC